MNIDEKENIEIQFWKNSITENPDTYSIENIIGKVNDTAIFFDKLNRYALLFKKAEKILEIGAGQGWASCVVKNKFPEKIITTTDISEFAIKGIHTWEHIYKVKIDRTASCKSYDTPFADDEFDLIFCFASAHHFIRHKKTLIELNRILTKGGTILYLYEPGCRNFLYKLARWRVNKKRPEIPEDILVYKKIQKISLELKLKNDLIFSPSIQKRNLIVGNYYFILSKLKFLQNILPCTIDFIFYK